MEKTGDAESGIAARECDAPRSPWSDKESAWLEEAFSRHLSYGLLLAFVFSLCLWGLLGLLAANLP